eukprot:1098762-Pleurochrysis_carterae.AAC.1
MAKAGEALGARASSVEKNVGPSSKQKEFGTSHQEGGGERNAGLTCEREGAGRAWQQQRECVRSERRLAPKLVELKQRVRAE